jgi:hypothetical protein
MAYRILSDQAQANTTPSQFANNRMVRLLNVGAAARTVTVYDNTKQLPCTINASANGTTLLTLTTGSNTQGVVVGQKIIGSSNLQVVNTSVNSQVATIVNTTAIASNVAIIIANGVAQVYTSGTKTFTMVPNAEFVVEKGRPIDFLQSNSDTDIVGMAVSVRG